MARAALRGRLTWLVSEVVGQIDETANVRSLVLDAPGWPGHEPGQHVDIRLTSDDGYVAERSYSIATPTDGTTITITVERLDDGEVSPYLVDELKSATRSSCEARSAAGSSGRPTWPARSSWRRAAAGWRR